ncbi:MAG: beta-ketoacyl-ACP synthase II [Eubacteriales bacterium]
MRRVVVTGIGAVTPIGNNTKDYWEALQAGVNGIAPISRFDTSEFKSTLAAEVKGFDASRYFDKITEKKTDLYVQYAIAAAQEAVTDSDIQGRVDSERFGVYVGSGVGGILTLCQEEEAYLSGGPKKVSPHFVPKMIINMAAGQVAIRFGAHGSALCLSTACATGASAIGEAYRAVKDGYLDAVICGGTEASINELCVAGFINCMALSQASDPNAASLPFDRRRGGFVLGEGAAMLVLESHEAALARGAHIYAEICGYGTTCDAHHVTAPDPAAEQTARVIALALQGVPYRAEQLYINAHGTGTKLNDKVETMAFKKFFGADASKLAISSTKSMTGHMLGAAGAAEVIACLMALETGVVPPTINLHEPDEELDLHYTPLRAERRSVSLALSTSLGFGGHNACLALRKWEAE